MNNSPEQVYQERIKGEESMLSALRKYRRRYGWLRLFIIASAFIAAMYAFPLSVAVGSVIVVVGIGIFLFMVSIDAKNNERIAHHERMLAINKDEVKVLHHEFAHRDDGNQFQPHDHPYANDLDLFGEYSLYQYINRCTSEQARQLLAARLLQPLNGDEIVSEQEAVKELAKNIQWRQELQAAGMAEPVTLSSQKKISQWLASSMPYGGTYWGVLVNIYTAITLATIGAYLFDLIPSALFTLLMFVFFVAGMAASRNITATYITLSKIVGEIVTLKHLVAHFEKLQTHGVLLITLQDRTRRNGKASGAISDLQHILNRFDYRLNILVFFVFNTLLLWDLRQLLALRRWHKKHSDDVQHWFALIAHVEVINTLATLSFNHPGWSFPAIVDQHFTLKATDAGHPLIRHDVRVKNSFSTAGSGKVSIITGSNMAGKSTFLRSIGVNIVLAQMGSAVCASSFMLSPVKLYTSMRIADNLAENTSTFYAELKKLQTIIEQVNKKEKIFILLDEILRGTNSLDRHTGSKALIKQLIGRDAMAVIATHDVVLADLSKSYITSITNYYFDVQVEGEELYFDYKLKPGVCQSLNASLLMKKIGIEV